jgi:hypothetical protein
MSLARNLKSKLTATTLAVGLSVAGAFGAVAPATAQDASANENIQNAALQAPALRVTAEEARLASANGIVLHFGDDISESNERVIQGGLRLAGYEAQVVRGGPAGHITLCVNERCGQNPMTVDQAHGFLLAMLDRIAPEYKFASNRNDVPTAEAG